MPAILWEAVESYAASQKEDRSTFIRGLVTQALEKANALPGTPLEAELVRFRELIATRGLDAVKHKLDELAEEEILSTGGGGR